ncbi:MAG: sirohydrochlorin cobaltochelatase [Veillonella sp.]|uniref:sirohydrochlorin cobaltochelatase n=1 Tax=Veillonella sp. TaxID=1926307 RepID=UPI0025D9839D|nr:sirohydrochlorin cobaltochelatase [Veillonella sp.]MBS4913684.1 sirohydrochlorin cobaltochelatase [Veillonella sp.]
MKQAILVVAFGTTVETARQRQINPVVEHIRKTWPEFEVRLAFTSRIIIKRLRERGEEIATELGAMEALIAEGYDTIYVQPLHFTGGEEFDKLKHNILEFEGQGNLKTVRIGRPLLYFMGQEERPDDYETLIESFIKPLNIPDDEGLLLIGHGGTSVGNGCYGVLQLKLLCSGLSRVRIAALECFPEIDDVALPWEQLGGPVPKRVHLHPLLLVAGDHALNDIFGDEPDSVVKQLEADGFEVVRHEKGLGEYETIQKLYASHLEDAMANRYEGRSKRKPAIPNIK